ncbi:MAG: hypothetical protein HYX27_14825 [Acidobacteria bacterium]|nr:hypothetical protein [Acidobacteriota bacterium]
MLSKVAIGLVLFFVGCGGNDEQAIRHLVVSELIQRESVPESHIEIETLQVTGKNQAAVDAKIRGLAGRSADWHRVHFDLLREGGRWRAGKVSDLD